MNPFESFLFHAKEIHTLTEYPNKIKTYSELEISTLRLCLGDLHGNTLKLFRFLIEHGVISLDRQPFEQFSNLFVELYYFAYDADIWMREYDLLKALMKIIENTVVLHAPHITLMGDVFSDRGPNDILTLMLLRKLHLNGINYTLLSGNHDVNFFQYCLTEKINKHVNSHKTNTHSLLRMRDTHFHLGFSFQRIQELFYEVVFHRIRLLECDIVAKGIILYMHAPMPFSGLRLLVNWLSEFAEKHELCNDNNYQRLEYKCDSPEALEGVVNGLNHLYISILSAETKFKIINELLFLHTHKNKDNPMNLLHWYRHNKSINELNKPLI